MRIGAFAWAFMAAGLTGGVAVTAHAKPAVETAKAPDLATRIQSAVDRYQSGGPRPGIEELAALSSEASADKSLDADLRADLATIYAYSLARARQLAKGLEVIKAGISDLAAAGKGESEKMGDLLLAKAGIEDASGDTETALATKRTAQALYVRLQGADSPKAATVEAQIAFSLFARGQLNDALNAYGESLPKLVGQSDLVRVYAMQMANYASALRLAGDLDESLKAGRAALDVARTKLPEGHPALLYALNNIGATLMDMGRYSEAEVFFREAVERAHKANGKQSLETAGFTYRLAQVLAREGKTEEASSLLSAALAELEGVNTGANPDLPGLIRLEQAQIDRDDGRLDAAKTGLQEGLKAIEGAGHTGDTTRARLQTRLAEVLLLLGDRDGALAQIEIALLYYTAQMPAYAPDRVSAGMLHDLILARLGRTRQALDDAQTVAGAMTGRLNGVAASRSEKADISSLYQLNFARFADIALSAGRTDIAFDAAQMASVSEVAATSQALAARAAASTPKVAELARQLQAAQTARLRLDRERNFAREKSAASTQALDDQIAAADAQVAALAAQLNEAFPAFDALSHPRPLGLKAAQTALSSQEAILIPLTVDDRVISLAVTRSGLTWDSAPLARTQAVRDVLRLRASVGHTLLSSGAQSAFDRAPAWELGRSLLTPKIAAALKQTHSLIVTGSGPLMTLPFALLLTEAPQGHDDDVNALRHSAWMIRRFALSVKPALTTHAAATPSGARGFLGVGAPALGAVQPAADAGLSTGEITQAVYRTDSGKDAVADVDVLRQMASLPLAEGELKRMQAALRLPGSDLITGEAATEARIRSTDLSRYSVIAFATHGLISGNLATLREPALVLTPPAVATPEDDGLLTASDVAGLRLNARWVILSACNTGTGRESGAAGYSGLARAFIQAGAQNLLVSLWPLRDDVADRISVDTVRRSARGQSQAEALRGAILSVIDDPGVTNGANPAIWAPFSLVVQ